MPDSATASPDCITIRPRFREDLRSDGWAKSGNDTREDQGCSPHDASLYTLITCTAVVQREIAAERSTQAGLATAGSLQEWDRARLLGFGGPAPPAATPWHFVSQPLAENKWRTPNGI